MEIQIRHRYLICVILMLVTFNGAACNDHRVRYILPDGYVGVIKIVLDEKDGLDAKIEKGTYTLEIPADGVLKLKSFKLFDPFYEMTVTEKSGKQLPIVTASDDVIAYRDTIFRNVSNGPAMAIIIIGTKKQTDQIRDDMAHQSFVDVEPTVYNQRFRNK